MTQTPVFLLTGFLGSGKTTLLARLVRHPHLSDTAVIVNEFGEVGLDHRLVSRGEEEAVVLLDNGCLCCAAGDSLAETLTELFHKRGRGEVPPFSRVVIETTGLADPGPILRTLMSDRVMTNRWSIAAVIATVDGLLAHDQLDQHREVRKQVTLADRLVVTKVDQASEAATDALKARLSFLNPRAQILTAANGDIDPDQLLTPANTVAPTAKGGHSSHHHHHDHGDHSGTIDTLFLPVPEEIVWADYAATVRTLQALLGERLLRTKGLLRIKGEPDLQVVQGVQYLFAPPTGITAEEGAKTGLVLIGEGLAREDFSALENFGVQTPKDSKPRAS